MKEKVVMPSVGLSLIFWPAGITLIWLIFLTSIEHVNSSLDGATGGHSYAPVQASVPAPPTVDFEYFHRMLGTNGPPPILVMDSTDAPTVFTNPPPEPPPLPPSGMAIMVQTN